MAECQRHVPIVVVATKKDAFLNQLLGKLIQTGLYDLNECKAIAEEKLCEESGQIEEQVMSIPGARVDAEVCVEQSESTRSR